MSEQRLKSERERWSVYDKKMAAAAAVVSVMSDQLTANYRGLRGGRIVVECPAKLKITRT